MVHQVFNSIGSHLYNGIVYDNWYFRPQFHNSFELNYIMKGEFDATVNGIDIHILPGEFFLISPNVVHDLRPVDENNNKFFTGVFSADYVSEFFKNGISAPFYKFVPEKATLDYLNEYMFYTGTPDLYTLKACTYAICAQAIKLSETSAEYTMDTNFVLAVNNYIAKNLDNNISRKDIASALNYEEHYFSTLFNNNFQINFNQYINMFRFERACRFLTSTDLKITDIAYNCGFTSLRSFNRIFKELSGKTPNEYRNSDILITEPDVPNMKVVIPKKN